MMFKRIPYCRVCSIHSVSNNAVSKQFSPCYYRKYIYYLSTHITVDAFFFFDTEQCIFPCINSISELAPSNMKF